MEHSYAAVCFDLFGTLVDGDGCAIDGAQQALASLHGARWAIVTSCGSAYARTLIAHAGLPKPNALVSSNDVERNKPAPEPYLAGARALGTDPAETLAIEDSTDGVESARAAGMDVIAVLRGRGLAFARRATFHVERFALLQFTVERNGSIHVRIEP